MATDGTSGAPGTDLDEVDRVASVAPSEAAATLPAGSAASDRDHFIDFVRAFSLLVVIAWHWVFTIIIWKEDGPHASNPIGFTRGLFIATWLLQVMPLFFFVGGYAHTEAYEAGHARGKFRTTIGFAWKRAGTLFRPALALITVWVAIGWFLVFQYNAHGIPRSIKLILSPLWFIGVYLLLILLFPISHWLHEKFGALVLVWGVGIGVLVDVARFSHDVQWAGWVNMVVIWGTCHQLGFFWEELVMLGRRVAWGLAWAGLFMLAGLVSSGLYPGSMVGVPGEKFSNMAPPTICILALLMFQAGVALLLRPWVLEKLATSRRWATTNEVINRFSLPLFLFHSTGLAVWAAIGHFVFHNKTVTRPTGWWWLGRPFAFLGPLALTLPIILSLGRQYVKKPKPKSPTPAAA
jgi:hypothetical protein